MKNPHKAQVTAKSLNENMIIRKDIPSPKPFKSKRYDFLKGVCMILIPCTGVLYALFDFILNIPYSPIVLGLIFVIDAVLGVIVTISSQRFATRNTGKMEVYNNENGDKAYHIVSPIPPSEVLYHSVVVLKIVDKTK